MRWVGRPTVWTIFMRIQLTSVRYVQTTSLGLQWYVIITRDSSVIFSFDVVNNRMYWNALICRRELFPSQGETLHYFISIDVITIMLHV